MNSLYFMKTCINTNLRVSLTARRFVINFERNLQIVITLSDTDVSTSFTVTSTFTSWHMSETVAWVVLMTETQLDRFGNKESPLDWVSITETLSQAEKRKWSIPTPNPPLRNGNIQIYTIKYCVIGDQKGVGYSISHIQYLNASSSQKYLIVSTTQKYCFSLSTSKKHYLTVSKSPDNIWLCPQKHNFIVC